MGATSAGYCPLGRLWTLLLVIVLNLVGGVTADCAAGSSTLTTKGCSGCGEFDLCLGFSSASECSGSGCETSGDCTYECMGVNPNLTTLVVLIEFGGFKSSREVAAGGFSLAGYPDLTGAWPSASNDDVTAVSTIDVSSAVNTLYVQEFIICWCGINQVAHVVFCCGKCSIMSGGTADVEYPQGKVASVTLTSDFISAATTVTKVVLQNVDLHGELRSLPSLLPLTVETIDLSNTLLSKFPSKLGDLTSLQQL
ncbi:unnamed protein product [Phytophthora lilii]|uniref:Unnamed protein product n=1 Tax=Phytophthora lilii TaxID=2077276 RepID=A0A9W6WV82_9STRA|nr:unnamed protein product [Phytophthora lilii]